MNHRSAPYQALVSSLADQEPRWGWTTALELPQLSAADAALVATEYPQEVDEGLAEALSVAAVSHLIAAGDVAALGLKYLATMSEAARHVVWHDVSEECARREDERADAHAERHPESPESAHGVAGLFR